MSASENKKTTQFIPILTEIIPSSGEQSSKINEEPLQEALFSSAPSVQKKVVSKSAQAHAYGEKSSLSSTTRQEPSQVSVGEEIKVELSADKEPFFTAPSTRSSGGQHRPPKEALKDRFVQADEVEKEFEPMFESLLNDTGNDVFSPLARNPLGAEDSVRPSDLMLLALTERISNKVRLRVKKDLDAHINGKVFPLLDEFAGRLVKQMETDLLKLMRESIAEVTREELEHLSRQRTKK